MLLAALAWWTSGASAVVVHTPNGHFLGIALRRGVAPAQVSGSVTARNAAGASSNANVTWHNGPVLHSSAPYLILWTPGSESIPASSEHLLERYFSDVAAASGASSNVYGVVRQYTDGSGFADYNQTFSPSSNVIVDANAYPTRSASCPIQPSENGCVTDAQIEAELTRLIGSLGLPTDGSTSAASLPSDAPIYFVVLPPKINVCDASKDCADTTFCAYHSSYTENGNNVLYAAIPFLAAELFPKGCQDDGNTAVQEPNGDIADVVLKFLSHEDNETITDPLGTAWWNNAFGNEVADSCNETGSANLQSGSNPDAFLPVLGGSAGAGTLYDQLISGDPYYLQSVWSNGEGGCEMAPSAGTVSAAFTQPPGPNPVGSTVTFNPSSSSSTNPYSSVTWSFGDGGTSFTSGSAPSSVQHTYTAAGVYPVTLTLVDDRGNIAKTSHSLTIGMPPSAAFSFSPPSPVENTSVSFDASGSSDPDSGVHITSYGWNFGDGTSQTVSTPTTNHVFAHYGTYTVTLTVTNSIGLTSTASHQVTVSDELPTAAFTSEVAKPTAGQSIPFDGSASNDPDGSIVSWAWSFGDGGTATGARPTHTYKSAGPYTVTLTVTDSDGETDATSQQLNVIDGPIASFSFAPTQPLQGDAVNFDGSTSTDPTGATITSYSWNFGDGTTGSGKTPIHSYAHYGTYTATLTVTDSNRVSDTAPETIAVSEHPPTASFTVSPANPAAGQPVAFDGTSSSDTDGPIVSYAWSFGDGGTASGANPTHVYATYGTYPVTLTVTDGENQSDSTTQQVTVVADPSPSFTVTAPTALISILTARPVTGQPVRFDGSRSSDPVGPIVSYRWRFGDGSVGGGVRATHSYRKPGDYRVSLTVTDASGQSAITQHLVRVIPAGITHLALRSFQTGATLLVSVNAGGVLFTARRAVRLRHPTTYRLRIDLSAVQLQQLGAGKSVTVRLSLRFAPRSGRASTQRLQIVFKRPAGHKLSATLRR